MVGDVPGKSAGQIGGGVQTPRCAVCDRRGWPDEGEYIGIRWYCDGACKQQAYDEMRGDEKP